MPFSLVQNSDLQTPTSQIKTFLTFQDKHIPLFSRIKRLNYLQLLPLLTFKE